MMLSSLFKTLLTRNGLKYSRLLSLSDKSKSLNWLSQSQIYQSSVLRNEKTTGWDKTVYGFQERFRLYDTTKEDPKIELRRRKELIKLLFLGGATAFVLCAIPCLFVLAHLVFL